MQNNMDIKTCLEEEHSKRLTLAIVGYVGGDKARFKELMSVFLRGDYRLTQRAAWPLSHIVILDPALLKPYFRAFISKLDDTSAHPAIARNIYRVLQAIEIPEKYHAELVDRTFRVISSEKQPAAIRAFAITVAARVCQPYPELRGELLLILQEMNTLPQQPAVRSRVKKALKELKPAHPKV